MMTELKNELNRVNNLGRTENGAVGYKSTNKDLLDLNFHILHTGYRKSIRLF